jgi:hypothetical protein
LSTFPFLPNASPSPHTSVGEHTHRNTGDIWLIVLSEAARAEVLPLMPMLHATELVVASNPFSIRTLMQTAVRKAKSVVFCNLCENLSDDFLFDLSLVLKELYDGKCSWEAVPDISVFTARDGTSLSRLLRRTCDASHELAVGPAVITMLDCRKGDVKATRRTIHGNGASSIAEARSERSVTEALRSRPIVAAIVTHGVESCARGDSTTVLCGRNDATSSGANGEGIQLACAHHEHCPRAPSQLPLSKIEAPVLFVGSCGSLRLADAFVRRTFNLALEFLDGPGLGYVGAIASSQGHFVAATAFAAALATGYGLARAVHWANAAVASDNMEFPTYLAVGHPNLSAKMIASPSAVHLNSIQLGETRKMDCGDRCCAEFFIDAPDILRLAKHSALGVAVNSRDNDRVYAFYRLEAESMRSAGPIDEDASGEENGLVLRLFIFTFPRSLGLIELSLADRQAAEASLLEVHHAIGYWREFVSLLDSGELIEAQNESLERIAAQGQALTPAVLAQPRINGSRLSLIDAHEKRLKSCIDVMRDVSIATVGPLLHGAFWLPNLLMRHHAPVAHSQTRCPDCDSIAIEKTLMHASAGTRRVVTICPRCLIVADRPEASIIESISFSNIRHLANEPVIASDLEILLSSIRHSAARSLRGIVCLSAPDGRAIADRVLIDDAALGASGALKKSLRFRLTARPINHFYFIKLFLSTETEFAFRSTRWAWSAITDRTGQADAARPRVRSPA